MKIRIEDLSVDAIERIEARMRPGQYSRSGFLADQERLADVIRRDESTLAERSLTARQIADRLESIIQQAYRLRDLRDREKRDGFPDVLDWSPLGVVEGRFEVWFSQTWGVQDCPFEAPDGGQCPETAGRDFLVRCRDTGEELRFSELSIHLIGDHHFFEGEVANRVDPGEVAGFFALEPGQSYEPEWKEESIWRQCWMSRGTTHSIEPLHEAFEEAMRRPEHEVEVGRGATLYFKKGRCLAKIRKPCVIEFEEIHGGVWTVPELEEGTYAFELSRKRFVPASPLGKFLSEQYQPPRRFEDAPPAGATPDEKGWLRCPGCGVKIKVGSSSYRDGRHAACGQRIQPMETVDPASLDPEKLDRFPESLRARGIVPQRCLNEFNCMYVWQVDMPPPEPGCRRSSGEPSGRKRLLRLVPDRISDEGHYGFSLTSVRQRLYDIAARMIELNDRLPSRIVGTDCRVEDGWFQGCRPWFLTPLRLRFSLAPETGSDRSWVDKLLELAQEVDTLWKVQPDLPFSIRSSNIFFDGEQIWLVDQGKAWLDELITDTYEGPYILMKDPEPRAFSSASSAGPPVRQFAALWTFLRTGRGALAEEQRQNIDRIRELDLIPGIEDGVSLLGEAERGIIETTLYGEQSPFASCGALMEALQVAVQGEGD